MLAGCMEKYFIASPPGTRRDLCGPLEITSAYALICDSLSSMIAVVIVKKISFFRLPCEGNQMKRNFEYPFPMSQSTNAIGVLQSIRSSKSNAASAPPAK